MKKILLALAVTASLFGQAFAETKDIAEGEIFRADQNQNITQITELSPEIKNAVAVTPPLNKVQDVGGTVVDEVKSNMGSGSSATTDIDDEKTVPPCTP